MSNNNVEMLELIDSSNYDYDYSESDNYCYDELEDELLEVDDIEIRAIDVKKLKIKLYNSLDKNVSNRISNLVILREKIVDRLDDLNSKCYKK